MSWIKDTGCTYHTQDPSGLVANLSTHAHIEIATYLIPCGGRREIVNAAHTDCGTSNRRGLSHARIRR